MNRRSFLALSSQAVAACALASALPQAGGGDVESLYRRALVIDSCASPDVEDAKAGRATLDEIAANGLTAMDWTVSGRDFESTVATIGVAEAITERDPRFFIARRHSDLERAKREQRIALLLGFQFPEPIQSDLKRIALFRNYGVRIMQLTYNNRGLFGDGCLEPGNAGLSKLGHAAIEQMNHHGVAVDLSHCGQRTTAEGIAASNPPAIITHTGCAALHPHPRNKADAELRACAQRGGYVGIYLMPYLCASPKDATTADVVAHLEHALQVCGEDYVGIGSDGPAAQFPDTPEVRKAIADDMANRKRLGIAAPEEDRPPFVPQLNTPRRYEILAEELHKKGHPDAVIEKVLGLNFSRAVREIWGEA